MRFKRTLSLKDLITKHSHFLFGPRGCGKSFLIHEELKEKAYIIDLLDEENFVKFLENPSRLKKIAQENKYVVIDEVQRLPELLNVVHITCNERIDCKFLLTGSSARKLRRGQANMLAGRAWMANLFPLTYLENPIEIEERLLMGALPQLYQVEDKWSYLKSYCHHYIANEIEKETNIRHLRNFQKFLDIAATYNAETLIYSNVASDVGLPAATVQSYFQILDDTLVAFHLSPWWKSKKRKAVNALKFYFFDTGVCHSLLNVQNISPQTDSFGKAFESFLIQELKAYLSYSRSHDELYYWREKNGYEVDALIGDKIAIEIKSKKKINPKKDFKGLHALREEGVHQKFILVSSDPDEREEEGIHCFHWKNFLTELWSNKIT